MDHFTNIVSSLYEGKVSFGDFPMLLQSLNSYLLNFLETQLADCSLGMVQLKLHLEYFTIPHMGHNLWKLDDFLENKFSPLQEKLFAVKTESNRLPMFGYGCVSFKALLANKLIALVFCAYKVLWLIMIWTKL